MTKLKFIEIKNRDDLFTRVTLDKNGDAVLSVGNQYSCIKELLSKSPGTAYALKVKVIYTAGNGKHTITRYI